MIRFLCAILFFSLPSPVIAQEYINSGDCSPVVKGVSGNVSISISENCTTSEDPFSIHEFGGVDARPPSFRQKAIDDALSQLKGINAADLFSSYQTEEIASEILENRAVRVSSPDSEWRFLFNLALARELRARGTSTYFTDAREWAIGSTSASISIPEDGGSKLLIVENPEHNIRNLNMFLNLAGKRNDIVLLFSHDDIVSKTSFYEPLNILLGETKLINLPSEEIARRLIAEYTMEKYEREVGPRILTRFLDAASAGSISTLEGTFHTRPFRRRSSLNIDFWTLYAILLQWDGREVPDQVETVEARLDLINNVLLQDFDTERDKSITILTVTSFFSKYHSRAPLPFFTDKLGYDKNIIVELQSAGLIEVTDFGVHLRYSGMSDVFLGSVRKGSNQYYELKNVLSEERFGEALFSQALRFGFSDYDRLILNVAALGEPTSNWSRWALWEPSLFRFNLEYVLVEERASLLELLKLDERADAVGRVLIALAQFNQSESILDRATIEDLVATSPYQHPKSLAWFLLGLSKHSIPAAEKFAAGIELTSLADFMSKNTDLGQVGSVLWAYTNVFPRYADQLAHKLDIQRLCIRAKSEDGAIEIAWLLRNFLSANQVLGAELSNCLFDEGVVEDRIENGSGGFDLFLASCFIALENGCLEAISFLDPKDSVREIGELESFARVAVTLSILSSLDPEHAGLLVDKLGVGFFDAIVKDPTVPSEHYALLIAALGNVRSATAAEVANRANRDLDHVILHTEEMADRFSAMSPTDFWYWYGLNSQYKDRRSLVNEAGARGPLQIDDVAWSEDFLANSEIKLIQSNLSLSDRYAESSLDEVSLVSDLDQRRLAMNWKYGKSPEAFESTMPSKEEDMTLVLSRLLQDFSMNRDYTLLLYWANHRVFQSEPIAGLVEIVGTKTALKVLWWLTQGNYPQHLENGSAIAIEMSGEDLTVPVKAQLVRILGSEFTFREFEKLGVKIVLSGLEIPHLRTIDEVCNIFACRDLAIVRRFDVKEYDERDAYLRHLPDALVLHSISQASEIKKLTYALGIAIRNKIDLRDKSTIIAGLYKQLLNGSRHSTLDAVELLSAAWLTGVIDDELLFGEFAPVLELSRHHKLFAVTRMSWVDPILAASFLSFISKSEVLRLIGMEDDSNRIVFVVGLINEAQVFGDSQEFFVALNDVLASKIMKSDLRKTHLVIQSGWQPDEHHKRLIDSLAGMGYFESAAKLREDFWASDLIIAAIKERMALNSMLFDEGTYSDFLDLDSCKFILSRFTAEFLSELIKVDKESVDRIVSDINWGEIFSVFDLEVPLRDQTDCVSNYDLIGFLEMLFEVNPNLARDLADEWVRHFAPDAVDRLLIDYSKY